MHSWSKQQNEIFEFFKTGKGNLVVRARAGTGKTTTILEGINFAKEKNILLVAFNKSIATELQTKLKNPTAEAKTLHSLGFGFILRNWRGTKVDSGRNYTLTERVCGEQVPRDVRSKVSKLASKIKNCNPFLDPEKTVDLAYDHDCVLDEEFLGYTNEYIFEQAKRVCLLSAEKDGTVDFDDMIFLPVFHKWVMKRNDLVVVDEAQDMNETQLLLAQGVCSGRMVIVGDDRQAIYGFRGADVGAIDRLKNELQAAELGLTVTYRCPKMIVDYARYIVPDYEAAPNAIDGTVDDIEYENVVKHAKPGDFILSRANAPLAGICLTLLRAGIKAKISGRDIAKQLLNLIDKWKDRGVEKFIENLTKWEQNETKKALKYPEKSREARLLLIHDQAETLRELSEGCGELQELRQRVENMFVDETKNPKEVVLCSTVHKAKGQERDRVFLFADAFKGEKKNIEEKNIEYVAVTRAKKHLTWIEK